ncbi:ankyrin [Tilletiaria anomala UBC 951]|uniref:Ankyrin n=1 Tax=Tilletiaria anomala (strain ATCC 24038 / CBS 436.72 / UBC 951) TaxID=1037660 RepID=A0A066WJ44_TILAU|nr:ankyrin [Tilletiaria anomala UBC 951]KDN52578.1 ankyrin [Tilletiaria anomala UBC 951]
MAETEGANNNQRLLFAARTDNIELLQEVLSAPEGSYDINFQDGLGMTALHYAASSASTSVLPELLEQEVDVDLHSRLEGNTPLHEAIKVEHEEARNWIVEQLLEAGADPREVNKEGDKPADIVSAATPLGQQLKDTLRKAEAIASISTADIANDDDDDDDGPPSDED